MTVASLACNDGHSRPPSEPDPADAEVVLSVPREANPAIESGEPELVTGSQCPGVRLYRVSRRWAADAGVTARLGPRYFGLDDRHRVIALRDVVLCELQQMHWVTTPHDEGSYLLHWRGPWLFSMDEECVWRGPIRTRATADGRALTVRERCVRPTRERTVTLEVDRAYRELRGP